MTGFTWFGTGCFITVSMWQVATLSVKGLKDDSRTGWRMVDVSPWLETVSSVSDVQQIFCYIFVVNYFLLS